MPSLLTIAFSCDDCIFDHKELELLISGLPTIDIEDLKENTIYKNYNK